MAISVVSKLYMEIYTIIHAMTRLQGALTVNIASNYTLQWPALRNVSLKIVNLQGKPSPR